MAFRITGLAPEPFKPLFDLSDEALAASARCASSPTIRGCRAA